MIRTFACALLLLLLSGLGSPVSGQEPRDPDSREINAGPIRLHYLDFGGDGPALIFLHSKPWDAWTYDGFAQRFTDEYRVLAPTFRGSGDSGGRPADVATDGEDVLRFMDELGIERAVLAGNSTPSLAMTYLAEHHSDRIVGLIFLAPGLPLGSIAGSDSLRIWEMTLRAQGENYQRIAPQASYSPHFLTSAAPTIPVPAMIFRNEDGGSGTELFDVPRMLFDGQLPIEDGEAAAYWARVRNDPGFPRRIDEFWSGMAARESADFAAFDAAFSPRPEIVRLPLPAVGGYEYREAPDLIEPHLRKFLAETWGSQLPR